MRTRVLPAIVLFLCFSMSAGAANPILSEIEIEAATRVERNAGVWIDGQYVGYVKNLHGSGKLVLVPGEHLLQIKLIGYEDIDRTITVDPGQEMRYRVSMREAEDVEYPDEADTARLRVLVEPEEAAIFIDGAYVGHVDRFNGRRGMRLASGTYQFTIALPGYIPFETELTLNAGQKYEIKTELPRGDGDGEAAELISGRIAAR
jgi:hypothetical protein